MTYFVCPIVSLKVTIYLDIFIENIDNRVNYILSITNKLLVDFSYAKSTTLSIVYDSKSHLVILGPLAEIIRKGDLSPSLTRTL